MKKGYYQGVNLALSYCNECGHQELDMDVCPECGTVHDRDLNASINLINLYNNHDIENIDESASVNLTL